MFLFYQNNDFLNMIYVLIIHQMFCVVMLGLGNGLSVC